MKVTLKSVEKEVGRSILVKNDQLNAFYAPHHYHPEYEIIYIKKSYGIRIIGNYIDNYQAGEVVILGPGLPHYHVVGDLPDSNEANIETIAVLFPESLFESNLQFPEFAKANKILEQIKYGIELTEDTKCRVQVVLEEMTIKPSYTNFVSIFKILEILTEENCSYKRLATVQYNNKKLYNEKTKHVLDFVANNFQNKIEIADMAEQSGLSKSAFCTFFKAQTGYTFSHYLNMLRISKACELLATTPKSVSEIAFEVGYENLAYFNRKFKEIKECTPKVFRNELG